MKGSGIWNIHCTKCKKPGITVLRQEKVMLCVVGMYEYEALLFLAAVAFCYSLFWLVMTSLKCVASRDGGEKVKCALVLALRLCTGRTAHRGSRVIALPFHYHGTRRG